MRVRSAALAAAATSLLFAGACGGSTSQPGPTATSTAEVGQRDLQTPVMVVDDNPSAPVGLTVDGAAAPIDPVATDYAGVLLPPQDVDRLGWWADSALPGSGAGSIVLVGHIDDVAQGDGFAARFADRWCPESLPCPE